MGAYYERATLMIGDEGELLAFPRSRVREIFPVSVGASSGELQLDYVENSEGVIEVTAERELGTDTDSQAFIRGNEIDLDGSTTIRVECYCAAVEPDFHNAIQFNLYEEDGPDPEVDIVDLGMLTSSGTGGDSGDVTRSTFSVKGERYLTPAAGTHRYQIRLWATATGSLNRVYCGLGSGPDPEDPANFVPAFYRVVRIAVA